MKENQVVIITGAAGGIGRACALKFAANGFAVGIADVDAPGLQTTADALAKINGVYLKLQGDLHESVVWKQMIEDVLKRWGRVDVLINNAAWRTLETMRTISPDTWERTLRVCLTAPAFLAKYSAAAMETQHTKGVIINLSSVMSQRPGGGSPAYAACKGGIESLTYELAALYGPRGIRVVAVRPGQVDSALNRDYSNKEGMDVSASLQASMNDHTPLQRAADPAEVANVCYWLSTSEASFVNGTTITVDGGFTHNIHPYNIKGLQMPGEF